MPNPYDTPPNPYTPPSEPTEVLDPPLGIPPKTIEFSNEAYTYVPRSGVTYDMAKHRLMPLDWHEIDGIRERFGETYEATRIFQGPWNTRREFRTWALGTVWNENDGFIHRHIPAQHPQDPWLYAHAVELVGGVGAMTANPYVVGDDGGDLGMIAYFDTSTGKDSWSCKLAVHYREFPYPIRTDKEMSENGELTEMHRYVSRTSTYALQSLPIAGRQLVFAEGPEGVVRSTIPAAAMNRLFPMRELTYTWHMVPDVPEADIDACLGKVNDDVFDGPVNLTDGTRIDGGVPATGYPAETLLFLAPHKEQKRSPEGRICYNITYKMLYRAGGHNRFPAANGELYLATQTGQMNGPKLFSAVNFARLFRMPNSQKYQSAAG